MIRMIFRISIRNFLKNEVYSTINGLGLALGFTAFIRNICRQLWVYLLSIAIIAVIVLLTTSYLTILAARRNPVEALRYE